MLYLTGLQRTVAQPAPLAPPALDPGVATALSQYAADAGYAYLGDCQTAPFVSGAVCTVLFAQADGSLLAGFYVLADEGTDVVEPFDALRLALPALPPLPPVRLLIPRLGVNAPVVTLGILAPSNTLAAPASKDAVGYYDFTPVPGYGGNTVLAGHVDWYTGEAGVFWNLKQLLSGDLIQLVLPDGTVATYAVSAMQLYDNDTAPIEAILGETPTEAVTLITSAGVFDPAMAEYSQRRVVRAERLSP